MKCKASFNENNITIFILIILLFIATFYPLINVGFTTDDDTKTAVFASAPLKNWLNISTSSAMGTGRVFFIISIIMSFIPYLINNIVYYKIFAIGSIIINILLFGYLLNKIIKSRYLSLLCITLFLCTIQNSLEYNLLTSYPFIFQFSLSMVFISLLYFYKYIETKRKIFNIISSLIFFVSLITYEFFIMYMAFFVLIAFVFYKYGKEQMYYKLVTTLRLVLPQLTGILIYVTSYFIFRLFYPGAYDGVVMEKFSIINFLFTAYKLSIASFPTYIFWHYGGWFQSFSDLFSGHKYNLLYILANAKVEWIMKSFVCAYLVYIIIKNNTFFINRIKAVVIIITSSLLLVLPVILHSLTPKYQNWIRIGGLGFTVTYFSFFGTILLISTLIILVKQLAYKNIIIGRIYIVTLLLGVILTSILTDYSNYYVTKIQNQSNLKWRTVGEFLKTDQLRSIPENSIIYSPTLWGDIGYSDTYWGDYINFRTNKNFKVVKTWEQLKSLIKGNDTSNSNLYFLKYSQVLKEPNQGIVFSKINKIGMLSERDYLYSDKIDIFYHSSNKKFSVFLNIADVKSQQEIFVDNYLVNMVNNDYYLAKINKEGNKQALTYTSIGTKNIDLNSVMLSNFLDYSMPANTGLVSENMKYNLGDVIVFGNGGNSGIYQKSGWSVAENGFTWSLGKQSTLRIPLEESNIDLDLKATISPFLISGKVDKQEVNIYVNEKMLGSWNLSVGGFQDKTISIPKSLLPDNVLNIRFELLNATDTREVGLGGDRVLAVAFGKVIIDRSK